MRHDSSGMPVILGYHAVSETWPAALAVTPQAFRRQLELLLRRGYIGTTFSQAIVAPLSEKTFAVTFDDAFRSVLEQAYPIMAELGVPGTIFAVTDFATSGARLEWPGIAHWRGGPHEHELSGLGWNELRRLADDGWEIGSHTQTHPRLTQLDDTTLARELTESRVACEVALGRPCTSVAYPFDDYDRRVIAAAAEAGYETAAIEGPAPGRQLAWPRVGVYRRTSPTVFRLKLSRVVGRVRMIGRADRAA